MPKRSEQRRRRNVPDDGLEVAKAPGAAKVTVPRVSAKWHPVVKGWFASLKESGQSRFYEPSDWAQAVFLAEVASTALLDGTMNAATLKAVLSGMDSLMTTESSRRRARIELTRAGAGARDVVPEREAGAVAIMARYRNAAAGVEG